MGMPPNRTPGPKSQADYKNWAKTQLNCDFELKDEETLYNLNVSSAVQAVQAHLFWKNLPGLLLNLADEYRSQHDADLFPGDPMPHLATKTYESVIDKTFRLNVLWNRNWPSPPRSGWVTSNSLYALVNDLIRSKIVCTFLDGPGRVAAALEAEARQLGLSPIIKRLSRDEGYYSHHFYAHFPISFATISGVQQGTLAVELQITTQPQELLRQLTHVYYREQRIKPRDDRDEWQWNFRTNKFKARYISHALHLLEAMILDVRDTPEIEDIPDDE
jgi:hypothetical protein